MAQRKLDFPSRVNRTCDIAHFDAFPPDSIIHLCGRLMEINEVDKTGFLRDASGTLKFEFGDWPDEIKSGDILEVSGFAEQPFRVTALRRLVPGKLPVNNYASQDPIRWRRALRDKAYYDMIRFRSEFIRCIRGFFYEAGFLEIDAPALVRAAGMEPHIQPLRAMPGDPDGEPSLFLHTSPEYSMKKMLVAGYEKIFFLGHVFRSGESGSVHEPEFTMLEWYRAYDDYGSLVRDCRDLVEYLRIHLSSAWKSLWRTDGLLTKEWEIVSLHEIMHRTCGFDLAAIGESDQKKMIAVLRDHGIPDGEEDWPIDDLFFLIFLHRVERNLGRRTPVIIKDYPLWMASLAKRKLEDPRFVERIELYIDGLELANGFTELNDPDEQLQRLENEKAHRRRLGRIEVPVDEDFIAALRTGMPPSAGLALGVDRLLMVCCGKRDIGDVMCYQNQDSLD